MNAQNPALIIRGPAAIFYKGKVIYSKGNIAINPKVTTFPIEASAFGVSETREATAVLESTFTPVGKIPDAIAVLYPHRSYVPGQLVHNAKTFESINLTSNVVTITAHGFDDGAGVRVVSYGVLPAGLVAATKYYLHKLTADTFTLHTSRAAALAGTGAVDITDAGTDTHRIIEEEELVIHSKVDGERITFHNACVTRMPQLLGAATKTALGDTTFTFYRKHGSAPGDANAFYDEDSAAFTDTSYDPADIVTEPYALAWGATAPWSAIGTKEGCTFDPAMSLSEVIDDAGGIVSHQIDSIDATLVARPRNVSKAQVLAKRVLQGAGSGRGRRITGDDLVLTGSQVVVTLTAASIDDSPINYDGKEDRIGDVKWRANRGVSGGVASALFSIAAP